ncbi:MAG: DNA-binding GntR family transcriptional regulator [Candidatus Azotimanducaceae bacterium]
MIQPIKSDEGKAVKRPMSEDDVLRSIEQAVIDNRLAPGTKLKEVQLAEVFNVKRGTIRKVLARLAHSRLVEQLPNRGASVAKPSVKEGQDLFAARRAIEAANLKTLAASISEPQVKQLRQLLIKEQVAYQQIDLQTALSLSVEFHRLIANLAGNSVMTEFLNDIIRRTPLVILTHLGSKAQNRCRNQEHAAIVDAIAAGDGETAVAIMEQHLLHIENQIEDKVETPKLDLAAILLSS